jgi:hypothetical protein
VHAGVADVTAPAERAHLMARFGGFTHHLAPERAGRAGDQNVGHRSPATRRQNGRLRVCASAR